VVAIEKTAQEQLHAVASQSEAAIDVAQAKLDLTGNKLREHEKLIKVSIHRRSFGKWNITAGCGKTLWRRMWQNISSD